MDWLKVGAAFDWITPTKDLIVGYNTVEYEGWEDHCKKVEKQLKKEGVTCCTQFMGGHWRVLSKK